MRDSTTKIRNFKNLRKILKDDGYLLIRNFVTKKDTSLLKDEISINLWGTLQRSFSGADSQDPRYGSNYSKAYSHENVKVVICKFAYSHENIEVVICKFTYSHENIEVFI